MNEMEEVENCDIVGQVNLFDTIHKKRYKSVTAKYRVAIIFQTSGTSVYIQFSI